MHLRCLLKPVRILAALALATGPVAAVAGPAAASSATFQNAGQITVPTGTTAPVQATTYPSPISVSGLSGTVTGVTITLNGVTTYGPAGIPAQAAGFSEDIGALLVDPAGQGLSLFTSPGNFNEGLSDATITISDSGTNYSTASSGQPATIPSSGSFTMRPADFSDLYGSPSPYDVYPSPAPGGFGAAAPTGNATLTSEFTGANPNGNWDLYMTNNVSGDHQVVSGGWSITITTSAVAVSTTTTLSSGNNPSFTSGTGSSVSLTASVSSGSGTPTGTVAFSEGGSTIAGCGAVALSGGSAVCTTSFATEGSYDLTATYTPSTGSNFLGSFGTTTQDVYTHTVVSGTTFTNPGGITLPKGFSTPTTADQYPSRIFVSGVNATIAGMSATLSGVNFQSEFANDLQVLLVGPNGAGLVLMSNVGPTDGTTSPAINDATFTFADSAAAQMPQAQDPSTGAYKPTDYSNFEPYPPPAPSSYSSPATVGSATFGSVFGGTNPNGTWELFVVEDGGTSDLGGSISGWSLDFTFAQQVQFTSTAPAEGVVGTNYDATATGSPSGVAVSYSVDSSSTAGACSVGPSTGVVSFLAPGTCVVDASQAATTGWLASNVAQQSIPVVAPLPQPSVTSLSPTSGASAGHRYLEIFGSELSPNGETCLWYRGAGCTGITVEIGGNPAFVIYGSPTVLLVLTPAGTPGLATVAVTVNGIAATVGSSAIYTYN